MLLDALVSGLLLFRFCKLSDLNGLLSIILPIVSL